VHVTATNAAELRSAKLTTLTVAELFSIVARDVGGRGSYIRLDPSMDCCGSFVGEPFGHRSKSI